MEFLARMKDFEDFCRENQYLTHLVHKVNSGRTFFLARRNYKDAEIQIYYYTNIETILKNLVVNLFVSYYDGYFNILQKSLTSNKMSNLIKDDPFFFSTKLEEFEVQNFFLIFFWIRAPQYFL